MSKKHYWLMKSEPDVYSIDRLKQDKKTPWEGVRNYQARNFMTKDMQPGDEVLFYHSSTEPPGIAGMAKVSKKAFPDPTQFDSRSDYYDKKATVENPIWFCVEIEFTKKFAKLISLDQIKKEKSLNEMLVLKKGQRLSVQPVDEKHFKHILKMAAL